MDDLIEKLPEEMPIELQLDLLVDEELPEERRRALLQSLDKMPAHWRELSIRFLERQTERKSARQLITSGLVASPKFASVEKSPATTYKFPARNWLSPMRVTGIAAGLLIAIGAGLMILHLNQPADKTPIGPVATGTDTVNTELPSSVVGTEIPVQLSVVDMRKNGESLAFFPRDPNDGLGSHRSVIIKPDGVDNALIIPVKNLQIQ